MQQDKLGMRKRTFKLFRYSMRKIIELRLSKLEILLLLYVSRNTSDNSKLKFKSRVVSELLDKDVKAINKAKKSLIEKELITEEGSMVLPVKDHHGFNQIDYSAFELAIKQNLNAAQIKTLIFIAINAYSYKELFFSKLKISNELGVNRETAAKSLKLFCDLNVIKDTSRFTEKGVSIYIFNSFNRGVENRQVGCVNSSVMEYKSGQLMGCNLVITYNHIDFISISFNKQSNINHMRHDTLLKLFFYQAYSELLNRKLLTMNHRPDIEKEKNENNLALQARLHNAESSVDLSSLDNLFKSIEYSKEQNEEDLKLRTYEIAIDAIQECLLEKRGEAQINRLVHKSVIAFKTSPEQIAQFFYFLHDQQESFPVYFLEGILKKRFAKHKISRGATYLSERRIALGFFRGLQKTGMQIAKSEGKRLLRLEAESEVVLDKKIALFLKNDYVEPSTIFDKGIV